VKLSDLPTRRIAKLGVHQPVPRDKPWVEPRRPKTYDQLTAQQRRILDAVPPAGASAPHIAERAGVSRQHAREVLGVLEYHGFVRAGYIGRRLIYTRR
jgi:hypothetical protein